MFTDLRDWMDQLPPGQLKSLSGASWDLEIGAATEVALHHPDGGPAIPLIHKGFNSRAIIDACKPYEWLSDFPKVVTSSSKMMEEVSKKWPELE